MKQLNLKALKHSKLRKENRIYEKAHRLIKKGIKTADLSEVEIMNIAKRYPTLKVKILAGGDLSIRSRGKYGDIWYVSDEGRFYVLYHDSLGFNASKKRDPLHVQDVFEDLGFIFASIVSHDEYTSGNRVLTNRDLLKMSMQSCL